MSVETQNEQRKQGDLNEETSVLHIPPGSDRNSSAIYKLLRLYLG